MRFVQGLLLGVAIGCIVAAAADVYRPFAFGLGIAAFVLLGIVSSRTPAAARRRAAAPARTPAGAAPAGLGAPTGFFTGRRLGDALAWLAQERGITTLESIEVDEDAVLVTDLGPSGRRLTAVEWVDGAFTADSTDLTPEPGAGIDTSGRFQARDLAPDVLPRALERARREHSLTWTVVGELSARVEQPDRLRSEVTVQLVNGTDLSEETLWASASGDVLYLQRSLA